MKNTFMLIVILLTSMVMGQWPVLSRRSFGTTRETVCRVCRFECT